MPKGQKKTKTPQEIAAEKKTRRESFEKFGGVRVSNTLSALSSLAKLANRKSFDFEAKDVEHFKKAIQEELDRTVATFEAALKTTVTTSGGSPVFKFG